jgi:hypothetical protein
METIESGLFRVGSKVKVMTAVRPGLLFKEGKVTLSWAGRYRVKFPNHPRPLWFDECELSKAEPNPLVEQSVETALQKSATPKKNKVATKRGKKACTRTKGKKR